MAKPTRLAALREKSNKDERHTEKLTASDPSIPKRTWREVAWWRHDLPKLTWASVVHGVKGFYYFAKNSTLATKFLVKSIFRGQKLTRREDRLLKTWAGDLLRIVPVIFFVIVPFAEALIPVYLKFFPNMWPSTFTTDDEKETKLQRVFNARLALAKFVIEAVKASEETNVDEFDKFIESIKSSKSVSKEQVFKFVTKFKDDITVDNLKRSQLQAMCKFLGIRTIGPTEYLRFALYEKIKRLKEDDHMIHEEGLNSLTLLELKQACAARGMNSMGSRKTLEALMEEWLELSLKMKVPIAMLILSRAFRLMSEQSSDELLKESIAHFPSEVLQAPEVQPSPKPQIESQVVGSVETLPEASKLLEKVEQISDAVYESVAPADFQKQKLEEIRRELQDLQNQDTRLPRIAKMVEALEKDAQAIQSKSKPGLDLDNDGLLSCQELSLFLKKQLKFSDDEVQNFLSRLDADKDGYVSVEHVKNLRDLAVNEDIIRDFILSSSSPGTQEPVNTNKDKESDCI